MFDDDQCPPILSRALNYRSWGVSDVMQLPAGMLPQMNISLNVYDALAGYKRAGAQTKVGEWSKKNPQQWELVTSILKERMKAK